MTGRTITVSIVGIALLLVVVVAIAGQTNASEPQEIRLMTDEITAVDFCG